MKPSTEDSKTEKRNPQATGDRRPAATAGSKKLRAAGFDVDAWEPSLLERMLRTVRGKADSSR